MPQTHGLIALAPILPGREGAVRAALDRLPSGADSPFARSGATHFARWVIINRLMYAGPPQPRDTLRSPYLLFTSHYDGALDAYLDELCARLPTELDALYRHCVGYPGVRDRRAFAAWLRRGQVAPSFYFGAYADASLGQVLTALDLRERLRAFALATQGLDAAALQAAYRRTFGPAADTAAEGQAPPAAAPREG